MKPTYKSSMGRAYCADVEAFIKSKTFEDLRGKVDLILTSPPFPLARPKAYGNRTGEDYKSWLSAIMVDLSQLLRPRGSLVVEIGNAWNRGEPTMSTLPLETLLQIKHDTGMHLCQQFIWQNPNKIPGPGEWVNVKRIRVKDSFTHIWWYSPNINPKADNKRVLMPYKESMEKLLDRQSFNSGLRPSRA